jgi:hypothetical protein
VYREGTWPHHRIGSFGEIGPLPDGLVKPEKDNHGKGTNGRKMRIAKQEDWNTEPMPPERTSIYMDRAFTIGETEIIRRGLVPEQMEDKWFIYWNDGKLFFHRSWTGYCIYVVHFRDEDGSCRMVGADVNRDPDQYAGTSDEEDAGMIHYLVDLLLLHRSGAFPGSGGTPEETALLNWSIVGRAMLGLHPGPDSSVPAEEASKVENEERGEGV